MSQPVPASPKNQPIVTIDALRLEHDALAQQRDQGASIASLSDTVAAFIRRVVEAGASLYDRDERRMAQSMANYWSNLLYRAGIEPPDATIALFDEASAPQLDNAACPYVGLNPFDRRHRHFFFGRNALVAEMVDLLAKGRFLAIIGSSGSGKSSLVRAGLIPALADGALPGSDTWRYPAPIVPGSQPLEALARLVHPPSQDWEHWR